VKTASREDEENRKRGLKSNAKQDKQKSKKNNKLKKYCKNQDQGSIAKKEVDQNPKKEENIKKEEDPDRDLKTDNKEKIVFVDRTTLKDMIAASEIAETDPSP